MHNSSEIFEYEPTQSEIMAFVNDKLGYSKPVVEFKAIKPTHGSLVLVEGVNRSIIKNDAPFALLNYLKSEYVRKGYTRKNLKIEYLK